MFAGIDIASERHVLARLDGTGQPLGRPIGIDEDAGGYCMLLEALGPPPALVVRGDRPLLEEPLCNACCRGS